MDEKIQELLKARNIKPSDQFTDDVVRGFRHRVCEEQSKLSLFERIGSILAKWPVAAVPAACALALYFGLKTNMPVSENNPTTVASAVGFENYQTIDILSETQSLNTFSAKDSLNEVSFEQHSVAGMLF